jgi:hypothetical protein
MMPRVVARVSGRSSFIFITTVDEEDAINVLCQAANAESFRDRNRHTPAIGRAPVI